MTKDETKVPDKPMAVEYFNKQIDVIDAVKARIKPDPKQARNCRMAGCHGSRGWYGINTIKQADGSLHIQLLVCCGEVGLSDYARLEALITTRMEDLQNMIDASRKVTSDILLQIQKDLSVTVGKVVAIKQTVGGIEESQTRFADNVEGFRALFDLHIPAIRAITDDLARPFFKRLKSAIKGRKLP